jgi:hypothetical protein
MGNDKKPDLKGQIVMCLIPANGYERQECFILGEDPSALEDTHEVLVFSVTKLLRANAIGSKPDADYIALSNLVVVASDLNAWVDSWNRIGSRPTIIG